MVTKIQTLFSLSKFNILLYIRKLTLYFPTSNEKHISWFSYIFGNLKYEKISGCRKTDGNRLAAQIGAVVR